MCARYIILGQIVVLLIFFTEITPLVEFTNIKCTSLDEKFSVFEYCHLKSVNRSFKYMSLKARLYSVPITKIKVNFAMLKRYSGYKPFLYNITLDACRALKNPKFNPVSMYFHSLFKKHSNMNHTCPYDHDLVVDKLPTSFINHQVSVALPFPDGDYLFHSEWYAYGVHRTTVDVFYTLS